MKYIKYLLFTLSITSCKSEKERKVIGRWYASQLIECGDLVPIQMDKVNFELKPDGRYIFNSALNIHEEGKYRIKGDYLYTKDLIKENAVEKIVKITSLNSDSLVLEMNNKGKDQTLTLLKSQNTNKAPNKINASNIK